MNLLLKNGRIVDRDKDFKGDILIGNGLIQEVGEDIQAEGVEVYDLDGKIIMPSFVELHAHFRDPGFPQKETIETGARAALRGGYTYVNLMGNTKPNASSQEVMDYVNGKLRASGIDGNQSITITKDFDGKTLSHLDEIQGIKVITDDGYGVTSSLTMYEAMSKAKEKDILLMVHAEDMEMTPISYRLSENLETIRDLYLAKETGVRLHLSHVSTKEAISYIREAKKTNPNITCEVAPHHIYLYDNPYRVNPPIRTREDTEEVIRGIVDGTVDAIATDHAPHTAEDKAKGSPGMSGIETAFSVSYTALVKSGKISMNRLSELLSYNPAKVMGINKGLIEKGMDGDFAVVDVSEEFKVDVNKFESKGKNSPFDGMTLSGTVKATVKAGRVYSF
ncbi:MAG: dihydroorotase [Tissierellia bacterium]|nr:dihydroorotase [Tissierellia bacterium]